MTSLDWTCKVNLTQHKSSHYNFSNWGRNNSQIHIWNAKQKSVINHFIKNLPRTFSDIKHRWL